MATCETCVPGFSRRHFLRFSLGGGAGLAAARLPHALMAQETKARQAAGPAAKSVILLWMGGGPSQLDSFDPKPGRPNGGEFKAIDTTAKGMQFSELLPTLASQGKHLSVLRTVFTGEGAHERGQFVMHTGMAPVPGLEIAAAGTVVSYEKGPKEFPLPHFIALDPPVMPQSTVFGEDYLPYAVANIDNPLPNLRRNVDATRDKDRIDLLFEGGKEWDKRHRQKPVAKLESAYEKSENVMNTPLLKAFDYREEPEALRKQFEGRFATHCLLARRLVQAGCSFVEIGLGGWDTHYQNWKLLRGLLPQLDRGMGNLVRDLAEKDLLKETLVVWAGEFGRTPVPNGGGRDHYSTGFSVVLAGGGIQGGRVVGNTGPDGTTPDRPISPGNLFATIYKACGINPEKKYVTEGRGIKYAYQGTPLKDVF
jgi:hypothetical protein